MRIAQVAPLCESVPPKLYGGTERVVSFLTEELVRQGHEVTLFASGDSETAARLVPCSTRALRLNGYQPDPTVMHLLMMEQVFARADQFDIIHFHSDCLHLALARRHSVPVITTLHGRLDLPHVELLFREYAEMPLVSISDAQRQPIPWARWEATVYHGLPLELLPFCAGGPGEGQYLAFTGRISPEKRPDLAIEIARRAGLELRIAAKVDRHDEDYFNAVIRPLLRRPGVTWVGEIDERQKADFLGHALATLFPIDWPEPFGLVMIESMSCGTPVIAFPRGSAPEVVDHGESGFLVGGVDEAVRAVERAADLDRRRIRARFEARFNVERMARDYLEVYRRRARGIHDRPLRIVTRSPSQPASTIAPIV